MSDKINFKSKILNIITFGYVNRKAKEVSQKVSSEIRISKNSSIDVKTLIKLLGNSSNIISVYSTLTTIKVTFKNKLLIDVENIKKLGAKGIFVSENYVSMVFGDSAKSLAEDILALI